VARATNFGWTSKTNNSGKESNRGDARKRSSAEPVMNNMKQVLQLTTSPAPIDAGKTQEILQKAAQSAIPGALYDRGWRATKTEVSNDTAKITFARHGIRSYSSESFARQWEQLKPRIMQKMVQIGWRAPKPENSQSAGDGFAGSGVINIPPQWQLHYQHIYDRHDQIENCIESLRTARDTDMSIRNHLLLYGPPGCGKTEVGLATARMLGPRAVVRLDATATTKAGAENMILNLEEIPPVLIIEELEKCNEANLPWLLGILDDRGEIIKTNARVGRIVRRAPMLVIATVNNMEKFNQFQEGALVDRFPVPVYFPRPDRALLRKILLREITKIPRGNVAWIEPALDYAINVEKTTQARRIKAIMTNARDRLLDGSFLRSQSRILERKIRDQGSQS
jgi:hypothetical protein